MRICPHCRTANEECNEATVTTLHGPMRIIGCRLIPRDAPPYVLSRTFTDEAVNYTPEQLDAKIDKLIEDFSVPRLIVPKPEKP